MEGESGDSSTSSNSSDNTTRPKLRSNSAGGSSSVPGTIVEDSESEDLDVFSIEGVGTFFG